MTTHTPGPWVCTHTSNHAHDYRLSNPTSQMRLESNETARCNARLIAAARDLLEALEDIRRIKGSTGGPEAMVREFHFIAEQAIAKAKK